MGCLVVLVFLSLSVEVFEDGIHVVACVVSILEQPVRPAVGVDIYREVLDVLYQIVGVENLDVVEVEVFIDDNLGVDE